MPYDPHSTPGLEHFPTQRSLARRLGASAMAISRLLANGKLKAAHTRCGNAYYRTADLDALLAAERSALAARASRLSLQDRHKLIAEISSDFAHLQFRSEPNESDRTLAAERVASALSDAKLAALETEVSAIAAGLGGSPAPLPFSRSLCQLRAERIDVAAGTIFGCTVATAGVVAEGKYVFLDAAGAITRDESRSKKRLPIHTDSATLETLLTAAAAAGGRLKSREDHTDLIASRAGYTDNFKRVGDRVVCDLHLLESYANRGTVLEVAKRAPAMIGLSIDFVPSFEVQADRALMRVESIAAIDIVDRGAVCPNGLL